MELPTTLPELHDLRVAVLTEIERLETVEQAPQRADSLSLRYLRAVGRLPDAGDGAPVEWVQPLAAFDAYPEGSVVLHGGAEWESLIPNNVWEPGNPNDPQSYRWWKDLTDAPEPPVEGETPAWDGNGHAYAVGDEVTYEGVTYRVRQAHTSQPGWTPVAVASLWEAI